MTSGTVRFTGVHVGRTPRRQFDGMGLPGHRNKVLGIDTPAIVAGVVDFMAVGDWATKESVTNAMGIVYGSRLGRNHKGAVSSGNVGTNPLPAPPARSCMKSESLPHGPAQVVSHSAM